MLGQTKTNLIAMLKAETGNSLDIAAMQDTALLQLLNNGQKELAARYQWPHLKLRADVSQAATTRTGTMPTTLNLDHSPTVFTQSAEIWHPVIYGINEFYELNTFDSDDSATGDPVQRWQYYAGDPTLFEVWPMPGTTATMRFVGQKKLTDISAAQTAGLDDLLLVYYVAAKYLTRLKSAQAQFAVANVRDRLSQLMRNQPVRTQMRVMGGGGATKTRPNVVKLGTVVSGPAFGATEPMFGY